MTGWHCYYCGRQQPESGQRKPSHPGTNALCPTCLSTLGFFPLPVHPYKERQTIVLCHGCNSLWHVTSTHHPKYAGYIHLAYRPLTAAELAEYSPPSLDTPF